MSLHSDKHGLAVLATLAEVSVDGRLIAKAVLQGAVRERRRLHAPVRNFRPGST